MKKKKLKKKSILFFSLFFLLFILSLFLAKPIYTFVQLLDHNYSFSISREIYEKEITNIVLDNEYSIFLDKVLEKDKYEDKYLESYFKVLYLEQANFIDYTYDLIDLGYSYEVINTFWNRLSSDTILKICSNSWTNIDKYLEYDYFKEEKIDRYISYSSNNLSVSDTIVHVNIGIDKDYYTDTVISDTFSYTMLVNKYYGLSENFKVENLEKISSSYSLGDYYLEKTAKEAFEKMASDMKSKGLYILANSTYRSYQDQSTTYRYYLKNNGKDYVDKYVARAGFTEHSTGLSIDIKARDYNYFKNSKESVWLQDNAHKYGFILRYPEGKEKITGFQYEAWHYRYVGVEIATYIYENDITFDEYYMMFLDR